MVPQVRSTAFVASLRRGLFVAFVSFVGLVGLVGCPSPAGPGIAGPPDGALGYAPDDGGSADAGAGTDAGTPPDAGPPSDAGVTCGIGFTACNGACVNVKSDWSNCGSCGYQCSASLAVCLNSTCTNNCSVGFKVCNHKCVPQGMPCP